MEQGRQPSCPMPAEIGATAVASGTLSKLCRLRKHPGTSIRGGLVFSDIEEGKTQLKSLLGRGREQLGSDLC